MSCLMPITLPECGILNDKIPDLKPLAVLFRAVKSDICPYSSVGRAAGR